MHKTLPARAQNYGIDLMPYTLTCCSVEQGQLVFRDLGNSFTQHPGSQLWNQVCVCETPLAHLRKKRHAMCLSPQKLRGLSLLHRSVRLDPPCTNSTPMVLYLNNPYVRDALHISPKALDWVICRYHTQPLTFESPVTSNPHDLCPVSQL